ncbi:MAG: YIP1 family protein [Ruminiclostridium sp.]|nr:YIP1 family protein [Ruminiclostridium sp.]
MSDFQTSIINEEAAVNKMGFLERVTAVITSPGKVMENLNEKPRILFPLFLIAFAQLALYMIRLPLYQDFLRKSALAGAELAKSLTGIELTPEMVEQSMSQSVIQSIITTPLGSLFGWLFITVIFFAVFKIAGGKGRFKQYLSVTGYAYVITALYLLITLVVSYFSGSLHMGMPLTSIAALFGEEMKGSFVFGMLKGLDVFSIWYYGVMAIGLTVVSGFKKRTVYGIAAGLFFIGLLIAGTGEAAVGAYL